MRSKYGYASPAGKIELPFVGVRMPMHFAKCPGLEQHGGAGQRVLNRKLLLRYYAQFSAGKLNGGRGIQTVLMRKLVSLRVNFPQRFLLCRRYFTWQDICLAPWKIRE